VIEQLEIQTKYAGYIDKQQDEVARAAAFEQMHLPEDLDYTQVTALSHEVRQKLTLHRPATLGQASRISGITPAAISLLLIHLRQSRHARVESLQEPGFDVVTSRAFASLADFVALTRERLAPGGVWMAMKGPGAEAERAALPPDCEVTAIEPLDVPGLGAQRCLAWMRPAAA
jgi:hypothetical protein